jgi:hypothetical protein
MERYLGEERDHYFALENGKNCLVFPPAIQQVVFPSGTDADLFLWRFDSFNPSIAYRSRFAS